MEKRDAEPSLDRQMAWEYFKEFEAAERHFNTLQSQYRGLASTWLLAAFAGIGFVVVQPRLTIPVDPLLAVTGIGLAATVGITLLWNLDLMIYHALMFEYFKAGLRLEKEHAWLPQVRTNIRERMKGKLTPRVALFYIAGNSAMLTVAGLASASWAYKYSVLRAVLVAALSSLVLLVLGLWMFRAATEITKSTERTTGEML